jgi:hypothetical protein
MVLHDVGYSCDVLKRAGARRDIPEHQANLYDTLEPSEREVRDFLAEVYTKPTSADYHVTAAIAQLFLACDSIAGIMYPAVVNLNVDNLALLPSFVESSMKIVEATAVLVTEVTPDAISGQIVARLEACDAGNLVWRYTGTTASTGLPAFLDFEPGQRKRVATAGRFWFDGNLYDFLPGYSIQLVDGEFVIRDLQGVVVQPIEAGL